MSVQVLLLPIGSDCYALPVNWIREVVAAPVVTRLVTAPPCVLGLFNLRGQVVPILDTAALLGVGAIDVAIFAVVVNCAEGLAGVAVTAFPSRATLGTTTGPSLLPGTAGLYDVAGGAVVLLDPAVLLTPERVSGAEHRQGSITGGVT